MNPFGLGKTVRVVNRVRDEEGKVVPWESMVGGQAFWIKDSVDLPLGYAQIAIRGSMYRIDPVTNAADYRLGCEELGCPEDPVPQSEVQRPELIDRGLLPPDRQKTKLVKIYNPIRRMDPTNVIAPKANDNGAFAGEFGERS